MALSSPEDICNLALREIGWPRPIGSIFEGSPAARAALDVYSETRDEVIRTGIWPFARRDAVLTLLKGPPPPGGYNVVQPWSSFYPLPPYAYEYGYPSDALEITAIIRPPGLLPDLDPKPANFTVANDQVTIGGVATPTRVVLTNVGGAIAIYKGRVTNPLSWPPDFIGTLAAALKPKIALGLARNLDLLKIAMPEAAVTGAVAERHRA
jgi:hypothetical protein